MGALSAESRAAIWRFAGVLFVAFLTTTAAGSAAMGGVFAVAARRLYRSAGWIVLVTWPLAFVLALTGWTALAVAAVFGAVAVWLGYRLLNPARPARA